MKKLRNLSIDWKVVIVMLLICALSTGVVGGAEKRKEVQLHEKAHMEMMKKEIQQKKAEQIKKNKEELEKKIKARVEEKEKEEQARLEEEQKAKEEEEREQQSYSSNNSYSKPVSNEPRYIPVINRLDADPDDWQTVIDARANGFYKLVSRDGIEVGFAHDYPYGKYYIADLNTGDKVQYDGQVRTVLYAGVIPRLQTDLDSVNFTNSHGGSALLITCYYQDGSYIHVAVLS